jgi:hypothetical protein
MTLDVSEPISHWVNIIWLFGDKRYSELRCLSKRGGRYRKMTRTRTSEAPFTEVLPGLLRAEGAVIVPGGMRET